MQPLLGIETQFREACIELDVKNEDVGSIFAVLAPLREKDVITHLHYLHSLRVGLLARQIGHFLHHEERPLLIAGALHDLGKCQVCLEVLGKSEGWSAADSKEIRKHVMNGYRVLRGRFDFSAEIIVWHHRFQHDGYPKRLPPLLHEYSEASKLLIVEYGRIIALADVYDALHRVNDKFGEKRQLSGEEVHEKMLEYNPDRKKLVTALYDANIFSV